MPTPRRGATAATLLAVFLTTLAALVALPTTASAGGAADPLFGAPEVGTCKDYGWELAYDYVETSEPVDCATSHTAKVIAIELLPDSLDWDSPAVDLGRYTSKRCVLALHEALGRTDKLRSMSAYETFWFHPTNAQKENGARWVRCDVTLEGGEKLIPLPVDTLPMLPAAPLPDSVALCLQSDWWSTACNRGHAWRATGGKTVDQDTYPGRKKLLRIARAKCPGLTTTDQWVADWPSRFFWKLGEHTIVCFSKTSN